MQPLPDYSEDYRERTSGTPVQLPVLPQNSEEPRSCRLPGATSVVSLTVVLQVLSVYIFCANPFPTRRMYETLENGSTQLELCLMLQSVSLIANLDKYYTVKFR